VTPYYDDGTCTIYLGDCRDVLPELIADVVITDPPYGINDRPLGPAKGRRLHWSPDGHQVSNTWHPASTWDDEIDPAWPALVCVTAPVVAWFGQWRKREEVAAAMPWPLRAEIIWAKDRHVGAPTPLAPRDERIWLFSAQGIKPRTFETTVWDVAGVPSWAHKDHKNEKPISLLCRLAALLTDPGQLILDPFMGSGTTLRAAKDLGRRAIGIEIEERYCEIAARRLGQEVLAL
jgi:site-specific DNA-methyltransferase (adenine-specific)